MIDAKHLRIGNLVLNDRVENTIESLTKDMCYIKSKQGNSFMAQYEFLNPIRLNEVWFEKLGFQEGAVGYYSNGDITVSVEGQVYFGETETWIAEISWVHQLQNLTFALTSTELTLKQQ